MNDFAQFLYTLRKEKGMTQAQLATLLGVTNKAVSKWETGEAMPETSLLLPLSRIFGVTVDELLDGKRHKEFLDNIQYSKDTQNFDNQNEDKDYCRKQFDFEDLKNHIFTRGKDENKSILEHIKNLVCSMVFSLGIIAFLILGSVFDLWTPYWVLIPLCALSCGIIAIMFDLFNKQRRNQKISRSENPFIGAICGIIVLVCMIVYLILGAIFSLWHPYWIIIVIGSFLCAIVGSFGIVLSNRKK